MDCVQATGRIIKRKAESQDNDRLSKRLSLLNLERNGQKLYVPVEQAHMPTTASTSDLGHQQPPPTSATAAHIRGVGVGFGGGLARRPSGIDASSNDDDMMRLDDSKHKVYIYDLDAELSDSESDDGGKLLFLPDIDKHLRDARIPAAVLAAPPRDPRDSQLVLYRVPASLSVPEHKDSVRKAIIEARARARDAQDPRRQEEATAASAAPTSNTQIRPRMLRRASESRDWAYGGFKSVVSPPPPPPIAPDPMDYDPDAMELC